jgi:hypothetical protein
VGSNPTRGMDVCVMLYNDSSMKNKKGLHSTKNGSKGKPPGINTKKKIPMVSLQFFIHIIVSVALWPWVRLSL